PSIRNVSVGNEDLRGNVPAGAAKWQLAANAEFHLPAVPGLSLHGNVRHTGKAPTNDINELYVPGYTTANAGFQFDTLVGGRKVTLTGNVNNLFNAKYWTQTNIGKGINATMSIRLAW
ncbi:MAG: TonB-dependent receptor, partial [Planctomycetota bacterium]